MGALCVQQQQYVFNERAAKVRKSNQAENTYMAQIIRTYTNFYGKPVTQQIKDFIQNNYDWSYYSSKKDDGVNRTVTNTYRSEIAKILQNAHNNGFKTYTVQYQKTQQELGRLWYNWHISTKSGMVRYRCFAEFNQNKKLFRQTLTRILDTDIPKYNFQKPKPSYDYSSSNNISYQRPPERFDGDAYVRQQNAEFRDRMNKQAQQWNNYATQKNNRGW